MGRIQIVGDVGLECGAPRASNPGMAQQDRSSPNAGQPSELVELMRAVANDRDRKAFSDLFSHFAPRLKGYLRQMNVAEDQLEDLIQEVMINVWRRACLYDARKAGVNTWVFRIARNKRIDAVRRERRPEPDPEDPSFSNAEIAAPDRVLHVAESAQLIRDALAGLPTEQATVLRMSFYEDKSHAAIADELGLPLGTVKSRVRLAVSRLRKSLEELQ